MKIVSRPCLQGQQMNHKYIGKFCVLIHDKKEELIKVRKVLNVVFPIALYMAIPWHIYVFLYLVKFRFHYKIMFSQYLKGHTCLKYMKEIAILWCWGCLPLSSMITEPNSLVQEYITCISRLGKSFYHLYRIKTWNIRSNLHFCCTKYSSKKKKSFPPLTLIYLCILNFKYP